MSFFRQFSAAVYQISRSIYAQTTNIQTIVSNIQDMLFPEKVGDVYFVDAYAGSDLLGDGSLSAPWKTIDYSVGQCTNNHNDYIIAFTTSTAGFDEDANVGGVMVDLNAIHIKAVDYPFIENSNAGATRVISISGIKVEISGFYCIESTPSVEGFYASPSAGFLYEIDIHHNIFSGQMENGIHLNGCVLCHIYNNSMVAIVNDGIELTGQGENIEIYHNHIVSAGDYAIHINGSACGRNWIYNNIIDGNNNITDIGIRINHANIHSCVSEYNKIFSCNISLISDIGIRNQFHNPGNEQTGSFNITAGDAIAETTKVDNIDTPITGEATITFDVSSLIAAGEGTQVYFYAYTKRDGSTYVPSGWCSHEIGRDKIHPSITIKVRPGDSELRIRSQVATAVSADRAIPYEIFWG